MSVGYGNTNCIYYDDSLCGFLVDPDPVLHIGGAVHQIGGAVHRTGLFFVSDT